MVHSTCNRNLLIGLVVRPGSLNLRVRHPFFLGKNKFSFHKVLFSLAYSVGVLPVIFLKEDDGRYLVSFSDVPEAITCGNDFENIDVKETVVKIELNLTGLYEKN